MENLLTDKNKSNNPNRGEKISLYHNKDKCLDSQAEFCLLKYYQIAKFGINNENLHDEGLHLEHTYGYTYYRNSIAYALKKTGVPEGIVEKLSATNKWHGLHFGQKHIGATSFLTAIGQEWIKLNNNNRYAYINPIKKRDGIINVIFNKFLKLFKKICERNNYQTNKNLINFVSKFLEMLFIIETIEYKIEYFIKNGKISSEIRESIKSVSDNIKKEIKKQKSIKKFIDELNKYVLEEVWTKIQIDEKTFLNNIIESFTNKNILNIKLILLDDFELSLLNFFAKNNINVGTLNGMRLSLIKIFKNLNAQEESYIKIIFVLRTQQGIDQQIIGEGNPVEIYRWWKSNNEIKAGLFPEIIKVIYCKKSQELIKKGCENTIDRSHEYLQGDLFKGTISSCSGCQFLFNIDTFKKINYEPLNESRIAGQTFEEISEKLKKYYDIFEGNVYYLLETIMSYTNVQDGCASERICLDTQARQTFFREWKIEQRNDTMVLSNKEDSFEDFLEMLAFYMPKECKFKDVQNIKKIAGRWLLKMILTCNKDGYVTTTLTRQVLEQEDKNELNKKDIRNGIVSALLDSRAIYFDYDAYEINNESNIELEKYKIEDFRYPKEQDKKKRSARAYQIEKGDELYDEIVEWLLPGIESNEDSIRFYKLNKFISFIFDKAMEK